MQNYREATEILSKQTKDRKTKLKKNDSNRKVAKT